MATTRTRSSNRRGRGRGASDNTEEAAPRTRTKRGSRARLARAQKIEKKLRGIKKGTGPKNTKKEVNTVIVTAKRVPVEIFGFLVSQDDHHVVFRHKRSSGSRKVRKSTFNSRDIIEVFGKPGEYSSIIVMGSKLINKVSGYIARSSTSGIIKIKDPTTEEISVIYPNDGVDIEAYVDEEDSGASGGRGRGRGRRKTVKQEDDYDEEDEYDEEI